MPRKIKVLQMPVYATGGVNSYVLKNWEFIDKSKFQFDFATLSKQPLDFEDRLKEQGCKVHYISCYAEENRPQFIDELNRIYDEGYDAVHLHTSYWQGFLMEEVAIQRNIPIIIVHSHSTMIDIDEDKVREERKSIHERLKEDFNTDLATHFFACSELAADWLFGSRIPRNKIKILNNAINIEEFTFNLAIREKMRKNLGLKDSFVIGHVGRFTFQKNHKMLINIFKDVCKKIPNAKLMLIGDGVFEDDIKRDVYDYGISERVLFLGLRNDISDLMQAMDIFVLPSRFEGLPIVLIEAQAAGLKCLASEFISKEVKVTPEFDFLPYDNSKWVDKIIAFASSGHVRTDMSNEVAKAGYSIKEQVKVLEKIYKNEI